VWFAAAVVAHDLVLFPRYALADRLLSVRTDRQPSDNHRKVFVRNYIRVPAQGAGLTLLVFLPGIIDQGGPTYQAATGQTQQPFLGRWVLLTATMFAASAVSYALHLAVLRRIAG
ncbi:membrane protein, partial [Mycobacterium numidiamassiliense]